MLHWAITIILAILLGLSIFANIVSLTKIDMYESWILSFQKTTTDILKRLAHIDSEGTFRSDDEVGYFFNSMKNILNELSDFGLVSHEEKEKVEDILHQTDRKANRKIQ